VKASEVPQDDSVLGDHRRACYAEDEDGRFVIVKSRGWEVERVVNQQAIREIREGIEEVRARAQRGELSPLAYHMTRCQMTPALLAANAGVWRWRVKRHLTPAGFRRCSPALLARYADALAMQAEDLTCLPEHSP
jgi:hypothetical protein